MSKRKPISINETVAKIGRRLIRYFDNQLCDLGISQ